MIGMPEQISNFRTAGFREVSFPTADGGTVFANSYGTGHHGVVLAHGLVFNKESWDDFARRLASSGYFVLAIDFRGYGKSKPGSKGQSLSEDVLAAVRYLRNQGAQRVSIIGGSMGAGAAAQAAAEAPAGAINGLILLSPAPMENPELVKSRKLFVASEDEPLAPLIRQQYELAPGPKDLVMLKGKAHAQHIFKTDQSDTLTTLILQFLSQGC